VDRDIAASLATERGAVLANSASAFVVTTSIVRAWRLLGRCHGKTA
jgi:hypothetical protein